ncbi:MAG: hypothetical protein IKB86_05630 [Clostridia bacterium]|nr:hypothetical protein [Clostridia bacterium]
MKRKLCIVIASIVATIFCLCSCNQKNIYINTEKSFYSNFEVKDGKVYIYCSLMIDNFTESERKISLTASFKNDARIGLLKESVIEGYSIDTKTNVFYLRKGENRLEVVFVGEYAGTNQKYDRLLPDIQIAEVK